MAERFTLKITVTGCLKGVDPGTDLFLIYINGLTNKFLSALVYQFADVINNVR